MIRCTILEKENTFLISLLESSTHFLYRERACEPVRLASGRLARASAGRACPSSGNRARDWKLTHLGVAAPDADDSGQGTALDPAWQGVFCVRLNVEPSAREMQPTAVCIDPGSKKEGYSVVAVAHTYLNLQADAVAWIKDAVKQRRHSRSHHGSQQRQTTLGVATELAAQCTDERVNMVTPTLFRKNRNAGEYATASQEELEQDIRSTGFYWTSNEDPVKVEQELMHVVPQKDWLDLSHLLIYHGRAICLARKPSCEQCTLAKLCPSAFIANKSGTPA
jgi:hypothetical protein